MSAAAGTGASGRWTTLDRIVEVQPGQSAVALRNVPNTLAILDSHFPRFPVMPGVLILGSLGELAAELLRQTAGGHWRLAGAERVAFRKFVGPGDSMELSVTLKSHDAGEALLAGEVKVDGNAVTRARKLRLVPVQEPA
jgi:3-hydroxyacyl-[acyl-carrier-protein] dehydratase